MTDTPPLLKRPALLALIAIVAVLWFTGLEDRALIHPDEGRYAEIPREMVATGDWLTPRLNGLKYFEKPPLQYWATAIGYELFGIHNWTARLWPVVTTFAAALFVAFTGARLAGPAAGVYSGAALLGSIWFIVNSHFLALDGALAALFAVAFCAFVLAQQDEVAHTSRRRWMWLAYAAIAGATLSKGLIAIVIPAASLVLYTLATRDLAVWRRLHLTSGVPLFLVLCAPWFIAVSLANDEFARFFFIHEHVERFLTTEHRRTGAWWYFVPLFLVGIVPWPGIILTGLRRLWRPLSGNANGFHWARFALVWSAFVFVFFSLSGSKLPSYILPMFPPLALAVGALIARTENRTLLWLTLPIVVVSAVAFTAVAGFYPAISLRLAPSDQPGEPLAAFGPWVQAAMATAMIGGIASLVAWRREGERARMIGVGALALSTLAAMQIAYAGYDVFRTTRSAYDILKDAGPIPAEVPFYQVHMYDQTVPFYLQRTTTVVRFRGELALGIDAEPGKAIDNMDAFVATWTNGGQAWALMQQNDFEVLSARPMPMTVRARDSRRIIVSRQ